MFFIILISFSYLLIYFFRGSALDNLVVGMGKKNKLSVMDKSKLDWDKYKTATGSSDELAHHKKNGCV
jgi:Bucentaur or craniofacial development